jgi:serine/threonine protein kinase
MQINKYRVQNMLGEGSNATVYRVQDDNGNIAVLKLFNQSNDPVFYDREFDNLGRIDHPAAPRLLDSGIYDNKQYCVIEFIEGENWEKKLETPDTITERQAIEWAIQICDFLSYIHNSQTPLIHRSLKPGNIMVQGDGKIRLLDFDIMEQFVQNQEYQLIGTEGYSPPEQYVGRSDPRSDIYALGASLYHLLTKRDPREGAPFMFHFRPPRSINPAISEALEAVILKSLEHKPQDRYQSALAMRAALEDCLSE